MKRYGQAGDTRPSVNAKPDEAIDLRLRGLMAEAQWVEQRVSEQAAAPSDVRSDAQEQTGPETMAVPPVLPSPLPLPTAAQKWEASAVNMEQGRTAYEAVTTKSENTEDHAIDRKA